ncbi:MAG: hypothetical protein J6U98_03825 [Abditibacteriota bacterium]|nr:hypothetical protein [Abditibacteriota bacterium]
MKRFFTLILLVLSSAAFAKTIPVTDPNIYFSPYTWKTVKSGGETAREAVLPGAYIKASFKGTSSLGLVIDAAASKDMTEQVPVIEYSVDGKPFKTALLSKDGNVYTLPMADSLSDGVHTAVIYLKTSYLWSNRYTSARSHLIVKGFETEDNGVTAEQSVRPKTIIGYGDSITEGVAVDGYLKLSNWDNIAVNNARCSWLPIVAAALDCEYGQVGVSAIGFTKGEDDWPLFQQSWDRYDAYESRLVKGRFDPEPDYIMLSMGTNDKFNDVFTAAYAGWMKKVRIAAPNAVLVLIVPPSGSHRDQINKAVEASSDDNIILIDTPETNEQVHLRAGAATGMAYDALHPNMYGQAVYASGIAARLSKALEAR